jgi:hypothetical protein
VSDGDKSALYQRLATFVGRSLVKTLSKHLSSLPKHLGARFVEEFEEENGVRRPWTSNLNEDAAHARKEVANVLAQLALVPAGFNVPGVAEEDLGVAQVRRGLASKRCWHLCNVLRVHGNLITLRAVRPQHPRANSFLCLASISQQRALQYRVQLSFVCTRLQRSILDFCAYDELAEADPRAAQGRGAPALLTTLRWSSGVHPDAVLLSPADVRKTWQAFRQARPPLPLATRSHGATGAAQPVAGLCSLPIP